MSSIKQPQQENINSDYQNIIDLAFQEFLKAIPPHERNSQTAQQFQNTIRLKIQDALALQNENYDRLLFELSMKELSDKINKHLKQLGLDRNGLSHRRKQNLINESEEQQSSLSSEDSLANLKEEFPSELDSNFQDEQGENHRRSKRRRYAVYDQEFKQEVCLVAHKKGISYATSKYELPARKVLNWVEAQNNNLLGKGRKALDPGMEYNLCIWILRKIWDMVPLTQKVIREKGVKMKTLQRKFNGSKGWLEKFFLRHVELKSSFDYRNQDDMREECARYHRYAFIRLEKDYEDFLRSQTVSKKHLISGDLTKIIYFRGSHPLLRLEEDKQIDKQAKGNESLFSFSKMLQLNNDDEVKRQDSGSEENLSQLQEQGVNYEPPRRKRLKIDSSYGEEEDFQSHKRDEIFEESPVKQEEE